MGFLSGLSGGSIGKAVAGGALGYAFGGPMGAAAGVGAGLQGEANKQANKAAKKGLKKEQKFREQVYAETLPARQKLQSLTAMNPAQLQPYQMQGRDDLQRQIQHNLTAAGTRGSPRAVAAGFDALGRYTDRAMAQNRGEQIQATNRLATIGYGQVPAIGGAYGDIGTTNAAYKADQGRLYADTIGTVFGAAAASKDPSLLARLGGR